MIDKLILDTILSKYKSFLGSEDWKKQERYKWKAVKTFQDNWNIDAADLPDMITRAMGDTLNLLDTVNNFPRAMLTRFAEKDPEEVRLMFRNLFDESSPLYARMIEFKTKAQQLLDAYFDKGLNHYQDEHAISVYLWLRYPDKNYIYQFSLVKEAAKRLNTGLVFKKGRYEDNINHFVAFYDELCNIIQKDTELRSLLDSAIVDSHLYYQDPYMKTLTIDLEYYIAKYYKEPANPQIKEKHSDKASEDEPIRYWMYAPGENASEWSLCQEKQMMCIGWHPMGDLRAYKSLDAIKQKLKEVYPDVNSSFMNDGLALWEFTHVVKPGDIVFAKQGKTKIIGRGIVQGDYAFDDSFPKYKNIRAVKWTHIGAWEAPGDTVLKTLTDITKYTDYVQRLESLFASKQEPQYWWLVAKPKIWSLSGMKNEEVQGYTLYNDNGNPRRVFQNFVNAKACDKVIGYEATPTKQIVALLEIDKESDGKEIWFRKTETLGTPIDYSELKNAPELKNMEFFVNPNGSLFRMTEDEYNSVMEYVREANPIVSPVTKPKYSKEDFLKEVFMEEADFDTLQSLLLRKKNVILQGAPGVGKTFAARRLAYAIMGEVDEDRIEQVQFHQNYSYEDFMMGYKPNEDGGFYLRTGVFYNFCKRAAAADADKPFFFIIDEINRGNISKIFGELLQLIENGYRDKPIKLSYRDERFAVPANVHVIGMMNTADRSLAMIDYALRRRFSFFDMTPGFETQEFRKYVSQYGETKLSSLIDAVVELNRAISEDESLGKGFCIGHSYFCNLKGADSAMLKSIVEYDILPMLREYWFDNADRFKEEAQKLRESLA